MEITVIGSGCVGLVTGTCLAESGHTVRCVDNDLAKVQQPRAAHVPIHEPGLDELLARNLARGKIRFTSDLASAVRESEIVFLALPTPPDARGAADLSAVLSVADRLKDLCDDYRLIVTKSTVPVGTAERIAAILARNPRARFDVASNPEFLREGTAVQDFLNPDRIVIGTASERARRILARLYEPFDRNGVAILWMDLRASEITKYAANAFLATKISFMNEIAALCEHIGADVDCVREGIGTDPRIGASFLYPGCGFGGSCLPKDVQALVRIAESHGCDLQIARSVLGVNEIQKLSIPKKITACFGSDLLGLRFAVWGLAFKPETDDIREAPALSIIRELLECGAHIAAYDPEAMPNTRKVLGKSITYGTDPYSVLEGADALIICTEWPLFRTPDFNVMGRLLRSKAIFDGRNIFDREVLERLGFYYSSMGRPAVGRLLRRRRSARPIAAARAGALPRAGLDGR